MGKLVFQATLGGQVNLVGPNTASTYDINVPAVAGNMVTTGDTGTVTNTMCATSVYTAPGTIGSGTPNTGAFTTLSASSTLSVTGAGTIQGLTVGKGAGAVSTNTAVGASALAANTTGDHTVAVGKEALLANTSGTRNVAVGSGALSANTTGSYNVGVGTYTAGGAATLAANTSGSYNTGVGIAALFSNTTASYNTAVGYQAGYSNTTGTPNSFFGALSGYSNTTGTYNTHLGREAGYSTTTGANNVSIGNGAFYTNSTGSSNTAIGGNALQANTTASRNTAVGYQAAYANTTGQYNTVSGYQALNANTVSDFNTAVGYQALYSYNRTADTTASNTALGAYAGYTLSTGQFNTFIGGDGNVGGAGFNATTGTYSTFVGAHAGYLVTTGGKNTILGNYSGNQGGLDIRTLSNNIVLSDGDGNPALYCNDATNAAWRINSVSGAAYSGFISFQTAGSTGSEIYHVNSTDRLIIQNGSSGVYLASGGTSWTSNSDERKKDIIEPITDAATKVSTLRAVIGKYKTDEEGTRRSFLIAQDVLAVLPEAVDSSSPDDLGVQYSEVIPLLVAAIKELNAQQAVLKAEIDTLKGN